MATISSSIVVQDRASSVFAKINSNLIRTTRGFKNLNNEMSVAPAKAINNAEKLNSSALQTELTYQAELEVLKQVEAEARKIIAAEGTQTTKAQDIIESVREQRNLVQSLKSNYDNVSQSIKNSHNNQEQFNNSINTSNTNSNKLLNTIKNVVATLGGVTAMKNLVNLSDTTTSNRSRLELIVDDNGSVADLENKIFAMSDRTRSDFLETTSVVAKLGILAGDSFKNTDEIIAFTELMNKNFAISGASVQEQTSAMYQLTQAMAAGKLQGDEFRSIMENAPLLAEAIAEYTGKSKGELKELSSEGLITADVIKNAMFTSANQINERYSKMPMTWSQIWTKMKNIAVKALDPVLVKINELANNEQVQEMFNMFIDGASLATQAILSLIEGVSWLVSVLKNVAPLIQGITGAFIAYKIAMGLAAVACKIYSTAETIKAASNMMATGATLAQTAAQWGLNTAMYACPITWIILLIVALIAVLLLLWEKCEGFRNFVVDMNADQAKAIGGLYNDVIVPVANAVIPLMNKVNNAIADFCENVVNANADMSINVIKSISSIIDKLNEFVQGYNSVANSLGMRKIQITWNESAAIDKVNEMRNSAISGISQYRNIATYDELKKLNLDKYNQLVDNIADTAKNMTLSNYIKKYTDEAETTISDNIDYTNYIDDNNLLGDIKGDTGKISDSLDITEEDLKYLIDLATRDTINRFTTVPLTINMTNNNNIDSETDIDGIVDALTSRLEEELEYISDGVHE